MNKLIKQKTSYALALLLGFVSVLGGIILPPPIYDAGVLEVHADNAVTPATYQNKSPWTVNIRSDGSYHFFNNNGDDTLTITDSGKKYYAMQGNSTNGNVGYALFYDRTDDEFYKGASIKVKFSGFTSLKAGRAGTLTVESGDEYTLDSPVTVNVKTQAYTIEDRGSMTAGKRYSAICGPTYETHYSFTPESSGNYIFAYTGEYWTMDTNELYLVIVGNKIVNGITSKSAEIGSSGAYKHSRALTGGHTYDIVSDDNNDFPTNTTIYFGIFPEGTSNDTILSVLGASETSSSSSSSGTTTRTSSLLNNLYNSNSSSSSSSSSGSSSSSSSASFSKGDTQSAGSGSSAADYVKTGTNTVKYDASQVSENATKANVPATVKIDGKTYKVTSISAGAFSGNTKIKEVNVGSNVKKIAPGAFKGCKNLKTLTVRSKNFTKESVSGAFKGASIKTVGTPPSKVDAYKNVFTKANTKNGSKINVKANKPKK